MNFVKANILNFALTAAVYVVNLLVSIAIARILGPEETGHFQIFVSTQTILVTFFSLGLGQASIYFHNAKKIPIDDIISTTLKVEALVSLAIIGSICGLVYFNTDYFGVISAGALIGYSLGSSALLFTTAMRPLLLAHMQVGKNGMVQIVASLGVLFLISICYWMGNSIEVSTLLVIYGIANIASAALLFKYFFRDFHLKKRINFSLFRLIAKLGALMSGNNMAQTLVSNAPLYALSWMLVSGFQDVGFFSRCVSVCMIATFINNAIGPLLYAKLAGCSDEEKRRQTKLAASFFLIFNCVMLLALEIAAGWIIRILYGAEFLPAVPMLRVMLLTLLFSGAKEVSINLIASVGRPVKILYNLIINFVIVAVLLFILIKAFGSIGAVWAVVITTAVTSLLLIRESVKLLNMRYSDFFCINRRQFGECLRVIKDGIK